MSHEKSAANLEVVQKGLMARAMPQGFFNPQEAFECLNAMQKADDPKAYESEIEQAYMRKKSRE